MLQLVEEWKAKELESYIKAFEYQMNHISELEELCKLNKWNINTIEEYRKIPAIFKQFRFNKSNVLKFTELAKKEIETHFKQLQNKVEKVIGKIEEIKPYGNNGYNYIFKGTESSCTIEVILAGGYNIQRLHTRWIIKK